MRTHQISLCVTIRLATDRRGRRSLRDSDPPKYGALCSHLPRLPLEGKLPTESGDEVVTWQKLSSAANTSSTAKAVCARAHQGSPVQGELSAKLTERLFFMRANSTILPPHPPFVRVILSAAEIRAKRGSNGESAVWDLGRKRLPISPCALYIYIKEIIFWAGRELRFPHFGCKKCRRRVKN